MKILISAINAVYTHYQSYLLDFFILKVFGG